MAGLNKWLFNKDKFKLKKLLLSEQKITFFWGLKIFEYLNLIWSANKPTCRCVNEWLDDNSMLDDNLVDTGKKIFFFFEIFLTVKNKKLLKSNENKKKMKWNEIIIQSKAKDEDLNGKTNAK